jgi:glycine/D-amino acid oxidase-like deaminating enzyme
MRRVDTGSPLAPSLWAATAEAAVHAPPLDASKRVEVAIVGAGYTGLSTALHLSELGIDVCVIDANEPGWGASGRNGGQVIPGLKYDPDELVRRFGPRDGETIVSMAGGAADTVFDLIRRHRIACDATRAGWIQPTHSTSLIGTLHARARQWEARGAHVELLDRAQIGERLGTEAFVGGWVTGARAACNRSATRAVWRARRSRKASRFTARRARKNSNAAPMAGASARRTGRSSTRVRFLSRPTAIATGSGPVSRNR